MEILADPRSLCHKGKLIFVPHIYTLRQRIALAIIPIINGLGGKLGTKFASINTSLK